MGIEINFAGNLQSHRIDEFHTTLGQLLQSIGGSVSRAEFYLPDDVKSHVIETDGMLIPANHTYTRKARGERVLVWKVSAPSFFNCAFAICCNVDWQGTLVLYDNKNWGSAYPLVSQEERLDHGGHDSTIHEVPVSIRRSDKLQGHLDAVKIADLLKEKFVPNLWVHDDTGYYEKRDIEDVKRGINMLGSFVPHVSRSICVPEHLKKLSRSEMLEASVDQLELGIRYTRCLKSVSILTIDDLAKKKLSELKPIKNMTDQGIRYVREVMESLGFSLQE